MLQQLFCHLGCGAASLSTSVATLIHCAEMCMLLFPEHLPHLAQHFLRCGLEEAHWLDREANEEVRLATLRMLFNAVLVLPDDLLALHIWPLLLPPLLRTAFAISPCSNLAAVHAAAIETDDALLQLQLDVVCVGLLRAPGTILEALRGIQGEVTAFVQQRQQRLNSTCHAIGEDILLDQLQRIVLSQCSALYGGALGGLLRLKLRLQALSAFYLGSASSTPLFFYPEREAGWRCAVAEAVCVHSAAMCDNLATFSSPPLLGRILVQQLSELIVTPLHLSDRSTLILNSSGNGTPVSSAEGLLQEVLRSSLAAVLTAQVQEEVRAGCSKVLSLAEEPILLLHRMRVSAVFAVCSNGNIS